LNKKAFTITLSLLLLLSGMLVIGITETAIGENVVIESNGAFFNPKIIDYTEEVELGDKVWIEYSVTNTGDATGTQDIILTVEIERVNVKEEKTHEDVTLDPDDTVTYEHEYDTSDTEEEYGQDIFEIKVEVDVTLETENASDSAKSTITSPDLIPGFKLILLVIAGIFAVVIYHTKKQ